MLLRRFASGLALAIVVGTGLAILSASAVDAVIDDFSIVPTKRRIG